MSLEPKIDLKPFARGTLPSWMSFIMLAILAYMAKGFMEDSREARIMGFSNDKRISMMEVQSKGIEVAITDLRLAQKDIVTELKGISMQLQKR